MFSSFKIAIVLLIMAGAGGGFLYVKNLKADLAVSEANNAKLEQSIDSQKAVIEQMQKDFKAVQEANANLNKLVNTLNDELKILDVNLKLISDGDICGALLVTNSKYKVDLFLGIGGGPEGVISAAALDAYGCKFQGRFLFETDDDKERAKKMGINDLTKKYELNEIVTGDSIFCATGITSGDLVAGIEIQGNNFFSETLVTHKSSGLKKVIKLKQNLK